MDLKQLILSASNEGASEIHLKISSPPIIRQRKFLKKLSLPAVQIPDMDQITESLLSTDDKKKFKDSNYYEGNFWGSSPCNFRLILFKSQNQTCALIKILSSAVHTCEGIR